MAGLITTQKPINELVRWFESGEVVIYVYGTLPS